MLKLPPNFGPLGSSYNTHCNTRLKSNSISAEWLDKLCSSQNFFSDFPSISNSALSVTLGFNDLIVISFSLSVSQSD